MEWSSGIIRIRHWKKYLEKQWRRKKINENVNKDSCEQRSLTSIFFQLTYFFKEHLLNFFFDSEHPNYLQINFFTRRQFFKVKKWLERESGERDRKGIFTNKQTWYCVKTWTKSLSYCQDSRLVLDTSFFKLLAGYLSDT
jgi:hypothetical protein